MKNFTKTKNKNYLYLNWIVNGYLSKSYTFHLKYYTPQNNIAVSNQWVIADSSLSLNIKLTAL